MRRVREYQQHAAECLKLAGETKDPKSKTLLLEMAQGWVDLKDEYLKRTPEVPEKLVASSFATVTSEGYAVFQYALQVRGPD
jgi:hypothetical protein